VQGDYCKIDSNRRFLRVLDHDRVSIQSEPSDSPFIKYVTFMYFYR